MVVAKAKEHGLNLVHVCNSQKISTYNRKI